MGPSGVGTLGIAAYANVPTRPTSSSNALSERFIGLLLRVCRVCRRLASTASLQRLNYTQPCNFLINRRLLQGHERSENSTGTPEIGRGRPAGGRSGDYVSNLR